MGEDGWGEGDGDTEGVKKIDLSYVKERANESFVSGLECQSCQ